jgi:hypothetical protein
VTAFLSVASKAAGFAGLLQVLFVAFEPVAPVYGPVAGVIAVLTMTIGNLTALQQRNVVRLFAYSSVAHAGYMLVPFALITPGNTEVNTLAFRAVLIYLIAYAITNVGGFAVITAMARRHPERLRTDYAGLGSRSPGMAVALTSGTAVPVTKLAAVSRSPGSRLNRIAPYLAEHATAELAVDADADDRGRAIVAVELRAWSRRGRRTLDAADLLGRWTRIRGSSHTLLRSTFPPAEEVRACAVAATDRAEELLDSLGWGLPAWTLTQPGG